MYKYAQVCVKFLIVDFDQNDYDVHFSLYFSYGGLHLVSLRYCMQVNLGK